jgi:hypothetical protein
MAAKVKVRPPLVTGHAVERDELSFSSRSLLRTFLLLLFSVMA